MKLSARVLHSEQVGEALKYIVGCGSGLLLKTAITALATWCGANIALSYLIANAFILFYSFFFHRVITFRRPVTGDFGQLGRDFLLYVPSVLCFMLLDYAAVVVAAGSVREYLESSPHFSLWLVQLVNTVSIFCSSAVLFTLRFFVYRYIFKRKKSL